MPTYEYRCSFCHEVTDAFQKMSDEPLVKCPNCGKNGLERIVSGGAGVIYKGEGWYVTDYSKKSSGGKEQSTKPVSKAAKTEVSPSATESKSETGSKPETESKTTEKPTLKPKTDSASTKTE